MKNSELHLLLVAGSLALAGPARTARAAEAAEEARAEEDAPLGLAFDLRFGARADYGLDDGSDLSTRQYELSARLDRPLGDNWNYGLALGHLGSTYKAGGAGRIGASGLEVGAQSTQLFGHLGYQSYPGFGLFVGPSIQVATEQGARLADGVMGGGFGGVTYIFGETLVLGLGAAVMTQLESGPQVLPILLVDWRMFDALKLTTDGRYGPGGSVELVYDFGLLETALAVSFRVDQYRLENAGTAPGGVIKETRVPLWLRLSAQLAKAVRTDLYVETAFAGSFELLDASGAEVAKNNFDPYLSLGLNIAIEL